MENALQTVKQNEIQKIEASSPMAMAAQLCKAGEIAPAQLKELLDIQLTWEANEANKAYSSDFAEVQSKVGAVIKTKDNSQTDSRYAGLEDVLKMVKPIYTEHGFSVVFYEGETDKKDNIRICADVQHKMGHKQTYHLDLEVDDKGMRGTKNKTSIHGIASSVSYARRYLTCMIWNIPTQDDDGNAAGKKPTPEPPTPEPPRPVKKNIEVLNKIAEILKPSEGREVDIDKLGAVFFASEGYYPSCLGKVKKAAEWVVKQNCEDRWTVKADSQPDLLSKSGEKCEKVRHRAYTTFCNKHADKLTDPKQRFSQEKLDEAMREKLGKMPTAITEVSKVLEQINPEDIKITSPF